mmetsp:Transcript_21967/g.34449  ORF Transcript_21967/g.34449 Transcript_21967/m.34449 type:complete len:459 (+) Transcript_21967:151-1527(+)
MPPLGPRSSSPLSDRTKSGAAAAIMPSSKHRCSDNDAVSVFTINTSKPSNVVLWKDRQRKQLSRLGEALSGPSRAIAPIAIIGGTFSVYSSAIQLSAASNNIHSAQFTPASILYLLLLALNYAIMPRLSKRYIHPNANKRSVALVEEVVKMSLGLGGWVLTGYASTKNIKATSATSFSTTMSVLQEQLQHWSPLSTLIAAGLPSALYALQGTLTYTAYQNLDSVTYNGLTQLKVLSSALCCYVILNKRQSVLQMASLGLLMLSSVVFQGSWKDWIRKQTSSDNHSSNIKNRRVLLMGVLPCLTATLLSGLAGAFSQRSLQTQVGGQMHRDAYFYTVEISFLSAVCLVISMAAETWQGRRTVACANVKELDDKCDTKKDSFFQHWTYATLLPITTRATAGLLTALVHRHLGSVVKGFALVLGLVFSALLQFVLEGIDLSVGQLVGTVLVLFSSWLHFKG